MPSRSNKCLISWKTKQQKVVAHSTMEAEYVAADEGIREAIWIHDLAKEITGLSLKIVLFIDNDAAAAIIKDPKDHERRKHIDIKHHFLRDCYKEGRFQIERVESRNNIADIFTKILSPKRFQGARENLSLSEELFRWSVVTHNSFVESE